MSFKSNPRLALAIALALLPTLVLAAGRRRKAPPSKAKPDTVEMFNAIDRGQIDVKLIPKDSTQSRVLIENKTKKPLTIKLPEAFAGVPVLAQLPGGGAGGGGLAGGGGQGFGGVMGMGGIGMGAGMGGMGGGFFSVPPEKVGKFKVTTVCLEHGKPEPRPAMKYQIKPIEEFTDRPAVHQLCRMLGTGRINQRAAQVAAWHLNNDMSWQQLAAKRIRYANGTSRPYFSPQELHAGMQLATIAQQRSKSPGENSSLSKN